MPGLAVIVAVIDDGRILLTKREDFEAWCLPGGGVEEGESLAEGAIREAREETGVEVELTSLVGVYSRLGGGIKDVHAVLFRARPIEGELRLQPGETVKAAYFPFDELPEELLFGHRQRIADAVNNIRGVAMRQELTLPDEGRFTRQELYALRDQSGLRRQEFYLQRIGQGTIREVIEVRHV